MYALKHRLTIPASRHIEIDLPPDVPEGPAEVIVLCQAPAAAKPAPVAAPEASFAEMSDEEWEAFDKALAEGRKADWFRRGG